MKKSILLGVATLLIVVTAMITSGCGEDNKVNNPDASFPTVAKASTADTAPTKYTQSTTAPPTTVAPTTKPQSTTVATTKAASSKVTSTVSKASTPTTVATQPATAATQPTKAKGSFAAADAIFIYNGTAVNLNSDIRGVLPLLGEREPEETAQGKKYTYDGFEIDTRSEDGADIIYKVQVTSGNVPTSKGVIIGSTADDVIAAYGDSYDEDGDYYCYQTDDGKVLQFNMEDGVVIGIDYVFESDYDND